MSIRVDARKVVASVSPLIFGAVDNWFDRFCHPSSDHYRHMVRNVDLAGITNFRMGGTPTEYYHWKDPEEYLETQDCIVKGKRLYGNVFPEEYKRMMRIEDLASFVGDTSSMTDVIIGINFMRGTAEEAAAWVRYANVEKKLNIRYWEIGNELGECIDRSWFPRIQLPEGYPVVSPNRSPEHYYFGGVVPQQGENLGCSEGTPNQVFRLNFPPVEGEMRVSVDGKQWTRTSDIRDAAKENAFQYREWYTAAFYWKGEVIFGDGNHGNVPPGGALIKADYDSGPHDGLVDYIAAMKAVDPAIKILACADEMDWWHTGLTRWTRELLELDAEQADPRAEFDIIAPHYHTILPGDGAAQGLHRLDNFEGALKKLKSYMKEVYEAKRHKQDMPIFVTEWKAVSWTPPTPQQLWSILFVVEMLGTFAKNGIHQASVTHVHCYLKTDGILCYGDDSSGCPPTKPMPIFFGFQLMRRHLGQVVVESLCDDYRCLSVYAGIDREKRPATLSVVTVNRDDTYSITETVHIAGTGAEELGGNAWTLTGDGMETDEGIKLNGADLSQVDPRQITTMPPEKVKSISGSFAYTFPPHSVTFMEFPMA
ncbi:MAG: hypothetical protein V2A58_08015 [Planctomycetota bacterium]